MADDADALLRRRRDLLREQAGLDKLPETWLPKWDAWEADVARYLEGTPQPAARRVDAAVELTVRQAIIDWNRAHVEPGRPFPPLDIDKHQEGSLAEAVLGAMIRLTADTKPSSSTRAPDVDGLIQKLRAAHRDTTDPRYACILLLDETEQIIRQHFVASATKASDG